MGHDRDAEMRSAQAHMSVLLLTATAEFDCFFFQSQTPTFVRANLIGKARLTGLALDILILMSSHLALR